MRKHGNRIKYHRRHRTVTLEPKSNKKKAITSKRKPKRQSLACTDLLIAPLPTFLSMHPLHQRPRFRLGIQLNLELLSPRAEMELFFPCAVSINLGYLVIHSMAFRLRCNVTGVACRDQRHRGVRSIDQRIDSR